jgi:hypothetical protein
MRPILFMRIVKGGALMRDHAILSEKYEDQLEAIEWGRRQAELIKKSNEITKELTEKYNLIIQEQMRQEEAKKVVPQNI